MSVPQIKTDLPREEKAIIDSLVGFGEKVKIAFAKRGRIKVAVEKEHLLEVARFARDYLNFDQVANLTGTDFPKDKVLEITYHLGSIESEEHRHIILWLSCRVPKDNPSLPSLLDLYPSANYHERETAEMIGCTFLGHPNLGRFMLPEDWSDIPPMLKAYRLPGRLESE
jgi:NADH:ubiquinone oxidoreductase subunit C